MTSPVEESFVDISKPNSEPTPDGWLLTLLSIAWILLWSGGCALLMFADPRPHFIPVWLVMTPMISMMSGQFGLPKEGKKAVAIWKFVSGLLLTIFVLAITSLGEETFRDNARVWGPGLMFAALGYVVAIASFVIRWSRRT